MRTLAGALVIATLGACQSKGPEAVSTTFPHSASLARPPQTVSAVKRPVVLFYDPSVPLADFITTARAEYPENQVVLFSTGESCTRCAPIKAALAEGSLDTALRDVTVVVVDVAGNTLPRLERLEPAGTSVAATLCDMPADAASIAKWGDRVARWLTDPAPHEGCD